ncbi:MAG: hypothetical protein ACXAEN_14235 [Candidatus Thorarchaeota archaeon]
MNPRPKIVLLGDEFGVASASKTYGVDYSSELGVNELGDLSMRSIFRQADKVAKTDWIAYVDTDVILIDDFMTAFDYLVKHYHDFVTCAGRWDADIPDEINFDDERWQKSVLDRVFKQHNKGSDYCIYRRGFYHNMPDFSIGRGAWDGWRMGYPKTVGVPLINIQGAVSAVHQKHGHRWSGHLGSGRNRRLAGDMSAWVQDADIFVTKKEVKSG